MKKMILPILLSVAVLLTGCKGSDESQSQMQPQSQPQSQSQSQSEPVSAAQTSSQPQKAAPDFSAYNTVYLQDPNAEPGTEISFSLSDEESARLKEILEKADPKPIEAPENGLSGIIRLSAAEKPDLTIYRFADGLCLAAFDGGEDAADECYMTDIKDSEMKDMAERFYIAHYHEVNNIPYSLLDFTEYSVGDPFTMGEDEENYTMTITKDQMMELLLSMHPLSWKPVDPDTLPETCFTPKFICEFGDEYMLTCIDGDVPMIGVYPSRGNEKYFFDALNCKSEEIPVYKPEA